MLVRVNPARRDDLKAAAVAVRAEDSDTDGWLRVEVTYQDLRHAHWVMWQLGLDAEVLSPTSLRTSLRDDAAALATRYEVTSPNA